MLFPALVLLAGLAAAPQPARADVIDNFASVLDQLPAGFFPMSGQDIRDSRGFFNELQNVDNDKEVADLLNKYHDKPIGQKALAAGGGDNLPSWTWDLLETYIAFRSGDFWGVVEHLGTAAICIVAQFLAGGTDVCGLLEALEDLAQTFEDALKAVGKFLASVGKTLEDIGCTLSIGDCGDSKPPEYYAYEYIFKPNIPEGAKKIEASDSLFGTFSEQLKKTAQSKQPAGSFLWQIGYANGFSAGVANTAASIFKDAADANWTKHYLKDVLPALDYARMQYLTPQKIADLAQKTAASVQSNHVNYLVTLCANDFKGPLGFLGLDRWMSMHPKGAAGLHVKSHHDWCQDAFWTNKEKFAQRFRDYTKANTCPEKGNVLLCPTAAKYNSCSALLGSVGLSNQCDIDVLSAGMDLALSINAGFKAKGSKYPCTITKSMSSPGSKSTSVALVCSRPTQWHACEDQTKPLQKPPVKLVTCVLEETPQYKELKGKVSGAVASLNQQYPNPPKGIPFGADLIDPLMVHAPSPELAAKVKEKNPSFGFGPPSLKPGFDYLPPAQLLFARTIDGVNTPLLGAETKLPKTTQGVRFETMQEKVILGSEPLQGAGATKAMSGAAPPGAAPGTGRLSSGTGASSKAMAAPGTIHAPKGPVLGGAPAPAQGKLPPAGGRAATAGGSTAGASADIKSAPRVMVAGKYPVAWGQGVTISAADARRAANGVCEVAISHETLNAGSAAAGPFGRRWANRQSPASLTDSYPPIPAGGSLQRTDTLALKPGVNHLSLTLDPQNQVRESDENNNVYPLTITVNGTCGMAPGPAPGGRTSPGTRLPAVQRK
jgi:hypothetical protein